MGVRRAILALTTASVAGSAAFAHHSPASYDLNQEITVEGTIAEVDWRNPHVYLTVETEGADGVPVLQEVEAASVSAAQSLGLSRNLLSPGAPVVIRAFANRRGPGRMVIGADVTFEDGSIYPLTALGRSTVVLASIPPADGIAGKWAPPQDPTLVPKILSWPITPAGRAAQAATATGGSVSSGCGAPPPPMLTLLPQLRTIEVGEDAVTIALDYDGVEVLRTVRLDQAEHPADVAPSLLGHSIGRWDGETLVIDTVAFEPHVIGIGFGVPSGTGKHLVERLTLTEDRLGLQYELTVEDPEYLSAPATYTAVWAHRPDLEPSGEACDDDNAARFLEE